MILAAATLAGEISLPHVTHQKPQHSYQLALASLMWMAAAIIRLGIGNGASFVGHYSGNGINWRALVAQLPIQTTESQADIITVNWRKQGKIVNAKQKTREPARGVLKRPFKYTYSMEKISKVLERILKETRILTAQKVELEKYYSYVISCLQYRLVQFGKHKLYPCCSVPLLLYNLV